MEGISACNARALVTLIAADDRMNRYRHPVPTELRWERTLMIVICARRSGLIASLTRIISAGEVPEDLKRRTISAARVSAELRHATRPGTTGAELYELAARCYRDEGWSGEEQQHHQGGACGYRTRDWVAHPGSADLVNEYQAFAWNPSITGTKVEGTCIAFPDRVETITSTPTWPQISTLVNGHEYFSPDIFSL
jgi:antitoxin VapB